VRQALAAHRHVSPTNCDVFDAPAAEGRVKWHYGAEVLETVTAALRARMHDNPDGKAACSRAGVVSAMSALAVAGPRVEASLAEEARCPATTASNSELGQLACRDNYVPYVLAFLLKTTRFNAVLEHTCVAVVHLCHGSGPGGGEGKRACVEADVPSALCDILRALYEGRVTRAAATALATIAGASASGAASVADAGAIHVCAELLTSMLSDGSGHVVTKRLIFVLSFVCQEFPPARAQLTAVPGLRNSFMSLQQRHPDKQAKEHSQWLVKQIKG
jgi:hypothetical protein